MTSFEILKENRFLRILQKNKHQVDELDYIKDKLNDDNIELTIENFLIELLELTEDKKRSASEEFIDEL